MTAIKAVEAIHQATRPTTSAWDTTIPPLEAAVSFTTIVPNDLLYGDSAAHLGSTMVARYRGRKRSKESAAFGPESYLAQYSVIMFVMGCSDSSWQDCRSVETAARVYWTDRGALARRDATTNKRWPTPCF
jgi:hypothetical protein